jgi:hypothetical protein
VLFPNAWSARYFGENNPDIEALALPPRASAAANA